MDKKTYLVTGGSGAVGSAIVQRLRQDGHETAFTFHRNAEKAEALSAATGAKAVRVDLTKKEEVQRVVEELVETMGPLDVLVNNAGATQIMPFALIEEEDWDEMMDANLKSMFLVTREVVRGMITKRSGVIINIGSLAGHRMLDVPVHYATAKAAVSGFTTSLAKELARFGIRVNSVVPGLLDGGVGKMVPEKDMADYVSHCSTNRPGAPQEVANVVAFLSGDEASYVNAQNIFVDGGI